MLFSILVLVIAFLSLIVLMVIHEFGHFIIAKKFGVRVDEFGIGYPPRIFGKKFGETTYSINWIPLGAFVKIYGEEGGVDDYRSFANLKIWQRVLIVIGGVAAFWVAAMVIFSIVFALGSELPVGDQDLEALKKPSIRVVAVANNSPAEKAGIKIGDTLLQVDGVALDKVKDFKELTQSNAGKNINIKIGRNNGEFSVSLSPRENPPAGEGAVGLALERMATLIEKTPWYLAPIEGIKYTWKITVDSLVGLYTMLSDLVLRKGLPQEAAFAGPVGITVFLANAAGLGISFFLYIVGVISVAVAIFNLFPIPALDGGKLVFLLIEKIKGRPVSVRIEQSITLICFAILIILSLFVTVKFDIPRITEFFKAL